VHLSFVRSITMDKWKDSELARMRVGGNKKALDFFESQSDYQPGWSIQDKYNSKAAALLRDKVLSESENRSWSAETSSARNYQPATLSSHGSSRSLKDVQSMAGNRNTGSYYGGGSGDVGSFQNSTGSDSHLDTRYQGFGNPSYQRAPETNQGDLLSGAMSSFSIGWNMLSKGASTAANIAKDIGSQAGTKVAELGGTVTEKIHEGGILGGIGSIASKANEVGHKSWSGISGFVASPSLQSFTFTNKSQYEDLGTPDGKKTVDAQQKSTLSADFGDVDSYSSGGDFYDAPSTKEPQKKSPRPKKASKGATEDGQKGKKPREGRAKKDASPHKPASPPLMTFEDDKGKKPESSSTKHASPKPESASSSSKKKSDKAWDDDAWDLLNQ